MLTRWKSTYSRHIRPYLTLTTVAVAFWVLLTLKMLSVVVLLIISITHDPGEDNPQAALESGSRAVAHLSTGEIEGNARVIRKSNNASADAAAKAANKEDKLPPAPLFALTEQSNKGALPIIGHDGTLPWRYYARPFTAQENHPMVAVILTNIGLNSTLTQDTLQLPRTITLSMSPFASDAKDWAKKLRAEGFETMVDLPMESDDFPDNEGDHYSLLSNVNTLENTTRLHWVLSRFPGFVGVLAPMREHLTTNIGVIRPVLTELNTRGILFLYLKNPANTALAELIHTQGFKTLAIDKTLDDDASPLAIRAQLKQVADLAKTQGYAIAVAHSYPPTMDALEEWATLLAAQNIDLVPVSAIARKVYP